MVVVVPDRSLAQRREALKLANEIRMKRAQLKRDLKARKVDAADIILDPPDWAEEMKLIDLLMAVPKWGRTKVTRVFRVLKVSPSKTIGGLSERQRAAVALCLRIGPITRLEEEALT